jgi:Flp pilus assembly protein TadG
MNYIPKCRVHTRRGVAAVEAALTLPVLFFTLLAMLDLGLAAVRYNALGDVAHRISRQVSLRGSLVDEIMTSWGPQEFNGTLADSELVVAELSHAIPTMQPEDVRVRVSWLDGASEPGNRVRVEVSYDHTPLVANLMPWGILSLEAIATLQIVN